MLCVHIKFLVGHICDVLDVTFFLPKKMTTSHKLIPSAFAISKYVTKYVSQHLISFFKSFHEAAVWATEILIVDFFTYSSW